MERTYLLGLGWILGLLLRAWPAVSGWGWGIPLGLGLVGSLVYRQRPRLGRTWLAAGLVGCLAWAYLGWRQPVPGPTDISLLAPQQQMSLVGTVLSEPRPTRGERQQFWLEAEQVLEADSTARQVSGKLYVTASPAALQGRDLHPNQRVRLVGSLYLPSPALNPGSFDFQAYLQRQGAFAGFSAREVIPQPGGKVWGGWVLRRRVREAFIAGLGERQGNLLASLVLGSRAGQLDFDLQDAFREIGMAHVLAASGFHVSLLLGVVFVLTRRLAVRLQQGILLAVLGVYLTLTGFTPSVLRAAVMGVAAMLVLTEPRLEGKVRLNPLGTLLVAAVLLLLYQPQWITDLGFQLSFAATLGLLVGTAPIVSRLDFLPPAVATALAVPLAAQIWTLPLQVAIFGRIHLFPAGQPAAADPTAAPAGGRVWGGLCGFALAGAGIPAGPAPDVFDHTLDQLGELDGQLALKFLLHRQGLAAPVSAPLRGAGGFDLLAAVATGFPLAGHYPDHGRHPAGAEVVAGAASSDHRFGQWLHPHSGHSGRRTPPLAQQRRSPPGRAHGAAFSAAAGPAPSGGSGSHDL